MFKKIFYVILSSVLFFIFNACSEVDTSDKEFSDVSVESSEENDNNDNYEKRINELEDLLSNANKTNEDLYERINDLESQIDNQSVEEFSRIINMDNGARLLLKREENSYTLNIEHEDKTKTEIIVHNYISFIDPSPDCSKIIFNDFEMEVNAKVFLYDDESKKTKELLMPELPENYTASFMKWLDNRYFLFIVQFDHGTIVRGGDVYVYDTEKDEYKAIIKSDDFKFQTCSFDIYGNDLIVFNSLLFEETMNFSENQHTALSLNTIYDAIKNNKVLSLNK